MLKKASHSFKFIDLLCCLPAIYFLLVTHGYWGETAPMDGMVYYRQATQFFAYGPLAAFQKNNFIHPPLFYIVQGIFFIFFGISPQTYTLLGYVLFVITSLGMYVSLKQLFNRRVALVATSLLFMNPHTIVGTFYPNPDIILMYVFIFTLFAHTYEKKLILMFSYVLLFLAKDTGLVMCAGIVFVRSIHGIYHHKSIKMKIWSVVQETLLCLPVILTYGLWSSYTNVIGANWREIFLHEETTETSYIVFAIKKLVTFGFINPRLIQSIFNIFALNFQWIYTALLLLLWHLFFKKKIATTNPQRSFILALVFTSILYLCVVLSFPTWTIPRYGIHMLVPLFFFLSVYINQIKWKLLYVGIVVGLLCTTLISNTASVDPVSMRIGSIPSASEWIYDSGFNTNGPDGLLYNFQYMKKVALQNELIQHAYEEQADYVVTDCDEFKLGERLYSINIDPSFYPQFTFTKTLECISPFEYQEKYLDGSLAARKIFVQNGATTGFIEIP